MKITKHVSRRFVGLDLPVENSTNLQFSLLSLLKEISQSKNLNKSTDAFFMREHENQWYGPFFSVIGQKDSSAANLKELNLYDFTEIVVEIELDPFTFNLDDIKPYLEKYRGQISIDQNVDYTMLVIGENAEKIALHFFIQ